MSPLRTSEPRRPLRHRAALSRASAARALLVRNAAHPILRSGCCWRDQREDLGVGPLVYVNSQEAHPLAWSIACGGLRVGDGRGVVSTVHGKPGTAEGMELQLEGTASSSRCPRGARDVAGELLGGRGVVERLLGGVAGCRCAGGEGEALVPSARCGGERAAGRRLRTTARDPSTRAASHALFGSFASRAYTFEGGGRTRASMVVVVSGAGAGCRRAWVPGLRASLGSWLWYCTGT